MPQHEVGYRAWNGKRTSQSSRWWIIAETGFQAALKSPWVRRILFVAWLPIFYWGTTFFVFENFLSPPDITRSIAEQVEQELMASLDEESEIRSQTNNDSNDDTPPLPILTKQMEAQIGQYREQLAKIRDGLEEADDEKKSRHELDRIARNRDNESGEILRRLKFSVSKLNSKDPLIKKLDDEIEDLRREINRRARIRTFSQRFGWVPGSEQLIAAMESGDTDEQRHIAWSLLLMTFFRYPQATMIIFLLGIISPGLVSRDMRSRAYLIYFSKPIGRLEYIMGKLAIPAVFLVLVTTLPAICLYALGVSLSPELSVVFSTWDIPFRILLASIVLIIPTACLSLMLSSLTSESRFATFAWFAVWILGHGAWMAIWLMQGIRRGSDPIQALEDPVVNGWSSLSLYNNLGNVQSWIFGLSEFGSALPGLIVLSLLSIFSIYILFRRVSAPIRV